MTVGLTCVPPNAKLGVPAFDPRYEGLLRSVYMCYDLQKGALHLRKPSFDSEITSTAAILYLADLQLLTSLDNSS